MLRKLIINKLPITDTRVPIEIVFILFFFKLKIKYDEVYLNELKQIKRTFIKVGNFL